MEGRDPRTHTYSPMVPTPPVAINRLGREFVETLVTALHNKVVSDPEVSIVFAESPAERATAMEREYVTVSLGGKGTFGPSKLREAHSGRGITELRFRRFLDLYLETLRDHNVSEEDIDQVIDRIAIASTDVLDVATEVG